MLLIKNKKVNFNPNYFKKITAFFKEKKISFELIESYPFSKKEIAQINNHEMIIVFGGDGTILNTFHQIKNLSKTFILPINFGHLGYITSIPRERSLPIIKKLINLKENIRKKKIKTDDRCLLEVKNQNKTYLALNELIITGHKQGKPVKFEVSINGKNLIQFKGDGIIIATATGSTAYNLSAGGPILAPNIEAFILTPVSPHSLNLKPIVLAKSDEVTITFEKNYENEKSIIIDGEKATEKSDYLTCCLSSAKLSFIKPYSENHFQTLKYKFFWGKTSF